MSSSTCRRWVLAVALPSSAQLEQLRQLSERAGAAILAVRDRTATLKEDGSLVTRADFASNDILITGIKEIFGPNVGILSEEVVQNHPDDMARLRHGLTVVIDPLDGTTNFNNNSPEYSVLVALLVDGMPLHGIAVMPAYGITLSGGSMNKDIIVHHHASNRTGQLDELKALTDIDAGKLTTQCFALPQRFLESTDDAVRTHITEIKTAFSNCRGGITAIGAKTIFSAFLPFLYPLIENRLYSVHKPANGAGDWDLAAWNAMAIAKGGCLTNLAGQPLRYLTGGKHSNYVYHQSEAKRAAYEANAAKNTLLNASRYTV